MRRKLLSVLLITMMLFSMVPGAAFAADGDFEIAIGTVNGTVGDKVTVNIEIVNNPGVAGFQYELDYNKDVLKFVKVVEESNTTSYMVEVEDNVVAMQQKNLTDTGVIAEVVFEITDKAGNEVYPVNLIGEAWDGAYDEVTSVVTAGAVTVSGVVTYFEVNVEGMCNADKAKAAAGETVTVTAEKPAAGLEFAGFECDDKTVTFTKTGDYTATFVMPENDVTVKAVYEELVAHAITVENGRADAAEAVKGTTVTVTASEKEGYKFTGWTGDVTFANTNATETTFTMPDKAVTVKANFEKEEVAPVEYTVTVNGGTANVSKAAKGATVKITATVPEGQKFVKWTGDVTFANANAAETTFTMPEKNVVVKATYEAKPSQPGSGSGSTGGGSSSGGSSGGGGGAIIMPSTSTNKDTVKQNVIVLTIGNPVAKVNGKDVVCDVAPLIVDGRTYTPSRFVAEQLGAKVDWNEAKQLVTITEGNTVIELTIGSNVAKVNGKAVEMDAAAFIRDGRTYTPSRFVAEQLGAKVDWNETTRQVTITETIEVK